MDYDLACNENDMTNYCDVQQYSTTSFIFLLLVARIEPKELLLFPD
jgi:hypothetical protein